MDGKIYDAYVKNFHCEEEKLDDEVVEVWDFDREEE